MEPNQDRQPPPPAPLAGGVFQIKSLDSILQDAEKPEYQLKRALGPVQLTLIGIGAIIGAGIFATIGTAAAGDANRPGAGPALMVSFVITAIVCGFTALCYAEFASMVPISGSAYTYSYATLGELIAWIIGWDLIIEYAVGNIAVAISWSGYFKTLLEGIRIPWGIAPDGIHIADWLSYDYRTAANQALSYPAAFGTSSVGMGGGPGGAGPLSALTTLVAANQPTIFQKAPHLFGIPIVLNLPAVLIVALLTIILIWGVRESARFNAGMVVIKLVVLAFFIVVSLSYVSTDNWKPFVPNGWHGISAGAAIIFFAYIGFDAVSTVAEETKNPQRNLPIGIIGSLVICTLVYVAVAAVFTAMISYDDLQTKTPKELAEALTMALRHVDPKGEDSKLNWAIGIVAFGSVVAHTAVLLVYQMGQPRIFFSMARDGLLPPAFARIHPRFRTPHISTIITGVFVAFFAAFASIDEMVDLTNIGTLFAFILVCAGIMVLRVKDPDRPRPFRVPGGLVLPALGILSCLYLIYYLPPTSWLRFAAWLNFGFVIYVGYGSVHSRLTGRQHSTRPADHDAHTAWVGAWLAIIGAALLVFMRGFDVYLGGTFLDVLTPAPWLEVSWFLIVPLALNAFVLAPIIFRRALRANRAGVDPRVGRTTGSIIVAMSLAAIALVYFSLVALHNLV